MNEPKVSILLTCYNFEKYIASAISSLLRQEFAYPYEIIVTDDGSTDKSKEILLSLPKNEKLNIIVNNINIGVANSLNNAFKLAKGKYLCRFDGDDEWHPSFLKELSEILDNNIDISMVYCNCSYIDTNSNITNAEVKTRRKTDLIKSNEFKDLVKDYYITAPTIMFRKEMLNQAFPLPTDLKFLDWYITLKVSQNHQIYYLDKCLANYRIHAAGMHINMVKDLYGEQTTQKILSDFLIDEIFTKTEQMEIKFAHAKSFILRYFGHSMYRDTRRVIFESIKNIGIYPVITDTAILKYFFASFIGKKYNLLKRWIS